MIFVTEDTEQLKFLLLLVEVWIKNHFEDSAAIFTKAEQYMYIQTNRLAKESSSYLYPQ